MNAESCIYLNWFIPDMQEDLANNNILTMEKNKIDL